MESTLFYIVDPRKVSYREHWALAPGWRGIKRSIACTLPISIDWGGTTPIAGHVPMSGRTHPSSQLPAPLRDQLAPLIAEGCRLGFQEVGAIEVENPFSPALRCQVAMRHGSGYTGLLLSCSWLPGTEGRLSAALLTRLDDRGWAMSTPVRGLRPPPQGRVFHITSLKLETLWEFHKLKVSSIRTTSPDPFLDDDDLLRFCDYVERVELEHHRARGVLRPLSPEKAAPLRARAQADRERRTVLAPGGPECLQIHQALSQSKGREIHSLLGTVVAAALTWIVLGVIGYLEWDALLPLCFLAAGVALHEAGHRLARRREQRQATSLAPFFELFMGPLPGLVLGTTLLVYSATLPASALHLLGLSLVLLNLTTLLPLPPWDGARFVRLALFSHHPWIAPFTCIVAMGGLAVLGWMIASWIPFLIALILGLTLPARFRLANLAPLAQMHFGARDREKPLEPEATLSLITAIREVFPNGDDSLHLSATAVKLYEIGAIHPPRKGLTPRLLLLYVGAWLLPAIPAVLHLLESPVFQQLASIEPREPTAIAEETEDAPAASVAETNEDGIPVMRATPVETVAIPTETADATDPATPAVPAEGDALKEALQEIVADQTPTTPSGNALDEALQEITMEASQADSSATAPATMLTPLSEPEPVTQADQSAPPAPATPSTGNALDEALEEILRDAPASAPAPTPSAPVPPSTGNALDEALEEIQRDAPAPAPTADPSAALPPDA